MLEGKEYFLGIQEDQISNPASSSGLEDFGKSLNISIPLFAHL